MKPEILNLIQESLLQGNSEEVTGFVKEAIAKKVNIEVILNDGLINGMNILGNKFKANEIFIPEVLIAAQAMQAGITVLEPHLNKIGVKPRGKIIIGTVKGDLHDIGKNLVTMMFRGAGFEVDDLGIDVPPEKFIEAVKKTDVHLLAMSALISTSLDHMKITILKLQEEKIDIKVIVGGAPVTEDYARAIHASGYAPDAASAVDKARELLEL